MKKLYIKIIAVLFVVFFLSSCITPKDKSYLQNEGYGKYQPVEFEEYRLVVNDEIIYYLLTSNQKTQATYNIGGTGGQSSLAFRIYEDGCAILPTIGKVKIAGLTIREAERLIAGKFKNVIPDAEIKVALVNNYFYVQGDGGKGQFFMYKENLNIFQAMAMAGDISSIGDKKNIKIIRKGEDGIDYIKTFDLRQLSIIESEFYYVKPNDVIYIPTNSRAFFKIESVMGIVSTLSLLISALLFFKK